MSVPRRVGIRVLADPSAGPKMGKSRRSDLRSQHLLPLPLLNPPPSSLAPPSPPLLNLINRPRATRLSSNSSSRATVNNRPRATLLPSPLPSHTLDSPHDPWFPALARRLRHRPSPLSPITVDRRRILPRTSDRRSGSVWRSARMDLTGPRRTGSRLIPYSCLVRSSCRTLVDLFT